MIEFHKYFQVDWKTKTQQKKEQRFLDGYWWLNPQCKSRKNMMMVVIKKDKNEKEKFPNRQWLKR